MAVYVNPDGLCHSVRFGPHIFPYLTSATCHLKVTSTSILPFAPDDGCKALPIIAPGSRVLSEPRIAYPGVEDVTSRSPRAIGPFSFVTLQGTIPTIATGISVASLGSSDVCGVAVTPGLVEYIPATSVE